MQTSANEARKLTFRGAEADVALKEQVVLGHGVDVEVAELEGDGDVLKVVVVAGRFVGAVPDGPTS